MPRPKGYRISRPALLDLLEARRLSLTELAAFSGVKLATLSGLAHSNHNASVTTVEALASALSCSAETLFPELLFRDLKDADLPRKKAS